MENTESDHIDFIPARMVNEYVYCPRLAYIEWIQADFAVNSDVVQGRFRFHASRENVQAQDVQRI